MKIYIIPDHNGYNKTILNVADKWREQGHEVQVDMYYDVAKAEWADVVFGEYIQGGIIHAMQDKTMKTPIIMRGIDIDLYYKHFQGVDWNRCSAVLFINDYMRKWIIEQYKTAHNNVNILCPVETVALGVDVPKWSYRERQAGKTIGWLNNFWSGKGVELLCQVIHKLSPLGYKFEVVGNSNEHWIFKYFDEFIERNGLSANVRRVKWVEDVNEWMEKIDFVMSTSMKECMSLPLAEAMAKGIKPVIHNWWGANELYGKEFVWNSVDEILPILEGEYDSAKYRKFIEDNFSLDAEVKKLDKYLKLCQK